MPKPFTFRVFVPQGNPEGLRIFDKMNWTGKGLIFPRDEWNNIKTRDEFNQMGVYILYGYGDNQSIENDDKPTLYIGQSDEIRKRIASHYEQKDFWETCIVFVSTNNGLNRAHITWLEYALIKKAKSTDRSILSNAVEPNEPSLTEADKADIESFLLEINQILPLAGINVFGSSSFLVGFVISKCNVEYEMQVHFDHQSLFSYWEGNMTKGCLSNVGRNIFKRKLNLSRPWKVADLELLPEKEEELIHIVHDGSSPLECPECGRECSGYDHRHRRWRHLDSHGYQSYLVCEVPRVSCPEHGVVTVRVPWADRNGRYTAAFEAMVIDWLKEASVSAVHRQLGLGWKAIYGIKARAVLRGLSRRESCRPVHVCVDETSFRKRHDYVTVVSDFATGTVHFVGEGRRKDTLSGWYRGLSEEQLASIESVSMDMWPAYINATLKHVPGAGDRIAFDRFHVMKKMNEAVDKVRRREHKALAGEGMNDLKGTRYDWLTNHANMPEGQRRRFRQLRDSSLRTARAWAIKELGMSLWKYIHRGWALKAWNRWLSWAMRCRLEPMKEVARMVRKHLWGIINAVVLKVSNGPAESLNSRIKMIKVKSRGYRNRKRFITDIYFHLGGLDLYPEGVSR